MCIHAHVLLCMFKNVLGYNVLASKIGDLHMIIFVGAKII